MSSSYHVIKKKKILKSICSCDRTRVKRSKSNYEKKNDVVFSTCFCARSVPPPLPLDRFYAQINF